MKELFKKYQEVISYLFWGVCTTLVSWLTYSLFVKYIALPITIGNILSWICAVAFAFVTNKLFVFNSKSWEPKQTLKEATTFVSARIATGCLEWFGVPFLVHLGLNQTLLGTPGMLSKILVSILVVILNYIFSKLLIFTHKEESK